MTRPFPSPPQASWDLLTPNYSCSERGSSLLSVLGPQPHLCPRHLHLDSCPTFCGEATLPPEPPSDYPPKAPFPPHYQDALYLSQPQFCRVTLILYNPTLTKPSSFPFLLAKYVCPSSLAGPLTVLHTPCLFLAQGLSHTLSHPQTLSSLNSPTRSYPVCPASWCSLSPALTTDGLVVLKVWSSPHTVRLMTT